MYAMVGNDAVNFWDYLGMNPGDFINPGEGSDGHWPPRKKCYCCCVEDLKMTADPVKPTDKDNPHKKFGHIITVAFTTSWKEVPEDKEGVCGLKWREKTNRPPSHAHQAGAEANKWYDATDLLAGNRLFRPFYMNNQVQGPGGEMLDPALINHDSFRRTLEIEVEIFSTPGCGCEQASKKVSGLQTLHPARNEISFVSPAPKGKK